MDDWDLYSAVKFPDICDTDMKTPVFSGITLFGDNIELMKSFMKPRRCWVIVVAGYDPSLPADEIKKALTDHFRSCGAILNVEMPRHPVESSVIIVGDDANEKALELDGSELGGRKLVVTARPFPMLGITLFGDNIELMKSYMKPRRCWVIVVAGYDPSLPADEIKKALTDHFRSCGAILNVEMPRHPVESSVIIVGDDANEKALELDGSELGGRKLVVTARPFPMLKRKDVPFASAVPATSQNLLNKMTEE